MAMHIAGKLFQFRSVLVLSIICSFLSCDSESDCERLVEEPTVTGHMVDISVLLKVPEFKEVLEKYPGRVQVWNAYENTDYPYTSFSSNLYYKGIRVFNESFEGTFYNQLVTFKGSVPDTMPVSHIPGIPINQAVKLAKQVRQFERNCISFQLIFLDIDQQMFDSVKDYHLGWKFTSNISSTSVVIDAHSGDVLMTDGFLVLSGFAGDRLVAFNNPRPGKWNKYAYYAD